MTLKYFSQFYGITSTKEDWFDPRMSLDAPLFIDPFLVFETELPLFQNAKEKFFNFFNAAFEVAHEARRSKAAYEKLKTILNFPEAKELCLGFSEKGTSGSGSGGGNAKVFADAFVKLADAGCNGLDHFEEIEIFTSGIGKDRISDATANIIKPELIKYTQQICDRFNVPTASHVVRNAGFKFEFKRWEDRTFSLPGNPFFEPGERGVILVPKDFLCAIHAIGSDGFENYIKDNKNEELRVALNYEIEKELGKFKKKQIVELAQKHPKWIHEYVNYIENEAEITPYNLDLDEKNLYRNQRKAYEFCIDNPLNLSASKEQEFVHFLEVIIAHFRKFIEQCDGYKLLWGVNKDSSNLQIESQIRHESIAQSLFADFIIEYCQANEIKIHSESNIGREIVEFSFPSGYINRAFIELKLARNSKLIQDNIKKLEKLPDYIRSHCVEHRYYVIISCAKKELEQLQNSLEKIKLIDFDDLQFQFIVVNAILNKSIEEELTGHQYGKLQEALIAAFTSKSKLEQMLSLELNRNLDSIAGGENLRDVVFNLIKEAKAQGWIKDLVHAACRANPGNPQLKAIAEELLSNYQ
jgi:Effector-associated domain 1